ncbi:MAG: hypothetical protein VYA84_14485 [Planctomycetota bacterium]|nr:hypothetical protein [Planctomycetota bacterium]
MPESNPYQPPRVKAEHAVKLSQPEFTGIAWRKILAIGGSGLLVGVTSRLARQLVPEPIHYEAIAAMVVLIASVLAVIYAFRRWSLYEALINTDLAITMLWGSFFIGWTIIHGEFWDDFILLAAMSWLGSITIGSLLIYVLKFIRTKSSTES